MLYNFSPGHAHTLHQLLPCREFADNGLSQVWLAVVLACKRVATAAYLQCGLPLLALLLGSLARLLQLGFEGAAAGRLARGRLPGPVWADILCISSTCTWACLAPQRPSWRTQLTSARTSPPGLLQLQMQPAADCRELADSEAVQEQ